LIQNGKKTLFAQHWKLAAATSATTDNFCWNGQIFGVIPMVVHENKLSEIVETRLDSHFHISDARNKS